MNKLLQEKAVLHRLLQSICWRGHVYEFKRLQRNEYGELGNEPTPVAQIQGIFHNGTLSHISLITSDAGTVPAKSVPCILTAWGNAEKLKLEDVVEVNRERFSVSGIENIGQMNIAGEVSLEAIL